MKTALENKNVKNAKETILKHLKSGALCVKIDSALSTIIINQMGDFMFATVDGRKNEISEDEIDGYLDLLKGSLNVTGSYPK